jgi:hypothetical protein
MTSENWTVSPWYKDMAMIDQLPGAPPAIAAALVRLKDELVRSAGKNLAGLILYGGLARGRYRSGKSDVNVVLLLHEISGPALAAVAPALRAAQRAANVSAMILTPAEVPATAAVFPIKFLDIKDHHVVLHGEDPFARLEVPREQIRLRVLQELRNLTLRLRRRFVAVADDPSLQGTALANLARPLAIELAALLRLAGKAVPPEDRTAAIFQAAAATFDADGEALSRLAALREGERIHDELPVLFTRLLATLDRVMDCAERLKEAPR